VEQDGNVYLFDVVTSLAYIPVQPVTECQAFDSAGQRYDLSFLISKDFGWPVTAKSATERYIINICHSVNNVNTTLCSSESSVHCFLFILFFNYETWLSKFSEIVIFILTWRI